MTWLLLEGLLQQSEGVALTTLISLAMDAPPSPSIRQSMYFLNAHICSQIWPQAGLRYDAHPAGFLNMRIAEGKHSAPELWTGCWGRWWGSGWMTMRMWWKAYVKHVNTNTRYMCTYDSCLTSWPFNHFEIYAFLLTRWKIVASRWETAISVLPCSVKTWTNEAVNTQRSSGGGKNRLFLTDRS